MVRTVSVKRTYIPKFDGNDKLPVADQVVVEHRAPTLAMKDKLFPRTFQFDKTGEVSGQFELDREKVIKEFNPEFKNLFYVTDEDSDVRTRIRTADDLFKSPTEFDPLMDELYEYFQGLMNRKFEEKN